MAKPECVCLTDSSLAIASLCRLVSGSAQQVSKKFHKESWQTYVPSYACTLGKLWMRPDTKLQALRHREICFDNYLVLKLNFIQKMLVKILNLPISIYRNLAPCSGLLINDFLVNPSYESRSKTTKRMDRSSYYPKSYSKPLHRHSERSPGSGFCCVSILLSTLWIFVCPQPDWFHH